MRTLRFISALASLMFAVAPAAAQSSPSAPDAGVAAPRGGKGEPTTPRIVPGAKAAPVETAPPNVPEFKPAFAGQTRAPAVKSKTPYEVTEIASGLREPWAIAFLPDGRMLVTEKPTGNLFIIGSDGKKTKVLGLPRVDGRDQGGLLDVEVGPDYEQTKLIYWTYYEPRKGGNGLAVARAKLTDGPKPRVAATKVIFRMQPTLDSTKHAGGRLVFARDGTLFVVLGERSILKGRVQARDLKSHFGKVVRINPDGSVPSDNPYVGREDARPEIWTSGHRNILSADMDSKNRLWIVEMGPRGGDELNLIERGKDYGWPTIGYGEEYNGERIHDSTQQAGLEQPVYYWDPVISPSGMTIYSGKLFSEWKDNVLIGGLSSKALVRLVMKGDKVAGEERLLMELNARIREVVEGPDGALYLLTDDENGKLLKLTPKQT